jgi:hypothetical protein
MLLTLEQINLEEQELDQVLNFLYEIDNPEEASLYARFIKEDATLDQKLIMIEAEMAKVKAKDPTKQGHMGKAVASVAGQLFGPFWIAYRLIKAFTTKCSRKCKVIGTNTFIRQKCMAECDAAEAAKAVGAVNKIQCKGDKSCETKKAKMMQKFKDKAANAAEKSKRYTVIIKLKLSVWMHILNHLMRCRCLNLLKLAK